MCVYVCVLLGNVTELVDGVILESPCRSVFLSDFDF